MAFLRKLGQVIPPELDPIPVFRPAFGEDELQALRELFGSGWLGPGPQMEEFEAAFAATMSAPHAVAVSSGTAALHLTCLALGLAQGDQVLVPALTFVSTAHAPTYCGAEVVFVDVQEETCNLDPADLRRKITPSSRGIIAVHYGGRPVDLDEIASLARECGLWLIEDAAHACGASYHGRPVGCPDWSDACCFSFNALKNLSTGDGGMVTTRSAELAARLRRLRWMGIDRSTFQRSGPGTARHRDGHVYGWRYRVEELGFKYTMNDISATLGLVQLRRLGAIQSRRRELARRYGRRLSQLGWIQLPGEPLDRECSWHLYAVRAGCRDALRTHLAARAIASSVHYTPLHLQPFYRQRLRTGGLPVAERLAQQLLTLPFHHNLTDEETERVLSAVSEFVPAGDRGRPSDA